MKKLGVIGGLGPMATAFFLEIVTKMTDASRDQEHIRILIDSNPQIPDRTDFILGKCADDPYPVMLEVGRELKGLGAGILAIPCNTAQYFHDRLEAELGLPIVNLIRETASYLAGRGISCAGIMATDGTVQTGLYQQALEEAGIKPVIPREADQQRIMHLIYENVKAGRPVEMALFNKAANDLKRAGAEVIILGCTELSTIKQTHDIGGEFIDAMEVMARRCVLSCGAPLKPEYDDLITK